MWIPAGMASLTGKATATQELRQQTPEEIVRLYHSPLLNPTPPANCILRCSEILAGDSFWNSCNWLGNGGVGFKQDN